VKYLQRLPKWKEIFDERIAEPDMWLVCPQQALLACYPELSEILKKIFGGCHRALKFYMIHDCDQIEPVKGVESLIVIDKLDIDFVASRASIVDASQDIDGAKRRVLSQNVCFGQLLNFV